MARTINAGDFNKGYQYEQAKKQERKTTRNVRNQRQNKQSQWQEAE